MINIRFSLRNRKAQKKSAVRASVNFVGERITFCTGISVHSKNWDDKSGFPRQTKGDIVGKVAIVKLKELDMRVTQLYYDLTKNETIPVPIEIFTQKVNALLRPQQYGEESSNAITLIDFADLFIQDSENGNRLKDNQYRIEESSIKPYRTTRLHLLNFQKERKKPILLSDFSQQLHDEFSKYLIEVVKLSKNAHSKNIMVLNQVIKYAVKKKLLPASVLIDVEFNTRREETDSIYLREEEIQLLMDLKDFKNKGEEQVRDIFVLGCYTGLRFSNYSQLNLDYLQQGVLTTIQQKTKKKVTIPIHPNVKRIIEKYKGVLPPCPTNQEFNRTLKDLGKKIPTLQVPFAKQITRGRRITVEETMKWEKLTTHTARRSFCTNSYLLGVPVTTIMAISGHRTEKSFRTYIKASGEEHAQIMKRVWDKKPSKRPSKTE